MHADVPAPWKRVALLLFCVGWGANHFVALLLVYKKELGLGAAAPAALFGMYALGLVPGLLLSGSLSERYGRRAIVLPAAIVTIAASAWLALAGGTFLGLLLGRLFYGLGAGAAMNPGAVWLLELSAGAAPGGGARRATLALSAGFGFGPLLSGLLAQLAPHPTFLPYVAHVVASAAALALAGAAPATPRPPAPPARLLRIGLDGSNRRRFVVSVAVMAPFVFAFPAIAFAALPAFRGRALQPLSIGALTALTLGAGMLAQPFTRRRAPTTAARWGLAVGAAGAAVGAAALAAPSPVFLVVAVVLLGAGYGVCMTSGLRNVDVLARPDTRAGLVGLYYVLSYVGFTTPMVMALVAIVIPPPVALLLVAGLALVVAVALRPPGDDRSR